MLRNEFETWILAAVDAKKKVGFSCYVYLYGVVWRVSSLYLIGLMMDLAHVKRTCKWKLVAKPFWEQRTLTEKRIFEHIFHTLDLIR